MIGKETFFDGPGPGGTNQSCDEIEVLSSRNVLKSPTCSRRDGNLQRRGEERWLFISPRTIRGGSSKGFQRRSGPGAYHDLGAG